MTTVIIILIVLGCLYIVGAVLVYGIEFAYWQRIYPYFAENDYWVDMIRSIIFGIIWPAEVIIDIVINDPNDNVITNFKTTGIKFW